MWIYRFIRFITFPLYWAALKIRSRENRAVFHEKMGRPTEDRPKGDLVWVRVNNFGESVDLVRNIQSSMPGKAVLLTYNARDAEVRNFYGAGVICQSAPIDAYLPVRNFLRFWEPSFAIGRGFEPRPYQSLMLKKFGILDFLVDGRVSDKKYRRWKWAGRMLRKIMGNFTFVWAVDNEQTLKLANLGAINVENQELIPGGNKMKEILTRIKQQIK